MPTGTEKTPGKKPMVTFGLVLLNCIIWVHVARLGHDAYRQVVMEWGWVPSHARLVTSVTSTFLHGSARHLIGNMIFLWVFGACLECALGRIRFLGLYLAGGVASSLVEHYVTLKYHPGMLDVPSIGASGAICAVMGMCMLRCYHSRIKMTLFLFFPLIFIPRRIKISPALLGGLYLVTNLMDGFKSLDMEFVYTGFWAHIGGFAFGILSGLCTNQLRQARNDRLRIRSSELLHKGIGLGQARKDLRELIRYNGEDGWALMDLARIEKESGRGPNGATLYRRAFRSFWQKRDLDSAITVFVEYFYKYRRPLPSPIHLRVCAELIKRKEYNTAAAALESLILKERSNPGSVRPEELERAYITLASVLDRMRLRERAMERLREYLELFPHGASRRMVLQKLRAMAGP